jgi:hypothetical protein
MNSVSENKLLDFERKNKTIIKEISNSIFNTVLEEFENYKDIKDNYRIKQCYLHVLIDAINEDLLTKFAFDIKDYYDNK